MESWLSNFETNALPIHQATSLTWASQVVLVVKNPPASAGDIRDEGLIPGFGRSPGEGHGNPFHYSCPENPKFFMFI